MNHFNKIIHGGDYNPDQWLASPEVIDEDIRLMKLAHINSATVGIFSWSVLEPEEGVFDFSFLDNIMDKLAQNGMTAILATPSGARPAWLAQKYPEVLRVEETGIRNEYGVRHNHCLTSPVYREKVRIINKKLAERYKDHPALGMWHISNEYSGACHCELCRKAFTEWLKNKFDNDLDKLNFQWWNGFWSHKITDWEQISSPKFRGENHVPALKLAWSRFVTDSHISFLENEIADIRKITPDIPVTTNFMRGYTDINYQKMSKHIDVVSWDNYPEWGKGNDINEAYSVAFFHDCFRSQKGGKPFLMMESTPSITNWREVNKLPRPGMASLTAMQAVALGSDSVQYFQWRKSRGGHEKFHGAVVDHCGHENTRVFKETAKLGEELEKLAEIAGTEISSRVAVVFDWENALATKYYCGYNNIHREYAEICQGYHRAVRKMGIPCDVIAMDDDFSKYDLVIAPFLYMLKDNTGKRIEEYVKNGGNFVLTCLSGIVNKNDLCYLGGFPGDGLRKVFGIWNEETDSLPDGECAAVKYCGKDYSAVINCDLIHSEGAEALGTFESEFYKGYPAVTVNKYGKGRAYYVAFRSKQDFLKDFCYLITNELGLKSITETDIPNGVMVSKRGAFLFLLNFSDKEKTVELKNNYKNVLSGKTEENNIVLEAYGYRVLR